jgi:glycosyltransferase involved in cell wall biosynthesis
MKKIHVLIIPSSFPGKFTKYSGVFYKEQTKSLVQLNAKIGVVCPEIVSMRQLKFLVKLHLFGMEYKEHVDGVPVYRKVGFNIFPFFRKFNRNLFNSYSNKLIKNYIKDHGVPDIVHCHGAFLAGEASLGIKNKYGIPYVITEHSSYVMKMNYSLEKENILKKIYQGSARLVAVGERLKQAVEKLSEQEVLVVPNVVDTSKFNKSKHRDPFELININTLSKNKRVDDLIESFDLVKRIYNNAKLHIVGDGPERGNLKRLVAKLGLSKDVIFYGTIPHNKINDLLEDKGILISTSAYETFGVTLIEAMAKGLPVVATRCGGPEDFVKKDNGILVEVGDLKAISEAIINVIENYNQYSSDNIASFVYVNFGNKSISKKLEKIYLSVIND